MLFNGVFELFILDTDITLRYGCAAVLQELLDQHNIVSVILIDLGGIKLTERMRRDLLVILQIFADQLQLFLHGSGRDREDPLFVLDFIVQAIKTNIIVQSQRNRKGSLLARLLLSDVQSVPATILDDVTRPQLQNIADPDAQVCFQDKSRGDPVVRPESGEPISHCIDDLMVLFFAQSYRSIAHFYLTTQTILLSSFYA